jgi:hypothetical protein
MGAHFSKASLVVAGLACSGSAAWATDYHPGFACPRPDASDPLTVAICADPAMAKSELALEKAYYAHRESEGPSAYHRLKVQAVLYDTEMRKACDIPGPGHGDALPPGAASCYTKHIDEQARTWSRGLMWPAYFEGERDIDAHIALQQKLAAGGLISAEQANGVYGDATRVAIITWQRADGFAATGFLSDLEARQLLADPPPGPLPPAQENTDKLQRIFTSDMLGVQVAYLEARLGPA